MSDNERGGRKADLKGLTRGFVKDVIFIGDDYNPQKVQPMAKKGYFDDDRRDIPTVHSSIPEIDGKLRIFVGKGDRVVVKIDKEMPNVETAAKSIFLESSTTALVINSGIGAVSLVLAITNQGTKFLLYDSNIQNASVSRRNLDANFEYSRNVTIIDDVESQKPVESVIYDISTGYSALQSVKDNVLLVRRSLKEHGTLYCITYTRAGAERHKSIIRDVFGDGNVAIITRGNGGYMVIKAVKQNGASETLPSHIGSKVDFSIFGTHFSLLTEPGLFSKDGFDAGTRLLLESINLHSYNRLLDLGCGWGPIGIIASTINPRGSSVMVDVDTHAVKVARENVGRLGLDNRVKIIATDDVRTIGGNFDLILSNPPLHADTRALIEMFKRVRKVLSKRGEMYLVVEKTYLDKFGQVLDHVFNRYRIVNHRDNYYILGV